jgi:hypothetical protein
LGPKTGNIILVQAGEFGSYQEAPLQLRRLIAASIPFLKIQQTNIVGLLKGFMVC